MAEFSLKKLALPARVSEILQQNLQGVATPFNFSVRGQSIGVHNWTHGKEEKSNRYLSPVNALAAIVAKLCDYRDLNRPRHVQDVVVLMVSAGSIDGFIEKLEAVAQLIPDPVFKQALSYAKSTKTLETDKMIKTPQLAHPCFGKQADITPQSARDLNAIMQNVQSGSQCCADPFVVLEQLKQQKAQKQAENQQKVNALLSLAVDVQVLVNRGLLDEVALGLRNVPDPGHIFTACLCLVGDDLTDIRGMLQDVN